MSVRALSAVFDESRARDSAFVVLVVMADWADHNGRCYPSYSQIATKARIARATAITAVAELIELGELARVEHGREPTPDDEEDAPTKVRSQWRNLYLITLVKRRRQVVQPSDHQSSQLPPAQVVQVSDYQPRSKNPEVVQSTDAGSPTDRAQVVQSTDLHIRIRPSGRPSGRPSDQIQAGAAPRASAPPPKKETPDPPAANIGLITKFAHEAMDLLGLDAADLPEAVKTLCATRIPGGYDSEVVRKAIESASWQRRHPRAGRG